ncbi:thioredoxin domain-containing protein [Brevibacterium sp. K11IcPPYGO002]|uniref:DsbA family protein n=1 Tax=Brevibacterium sp. K11IcPPYGO002 TaxID=3058837 RepID=UPI003D816ED8
MLRSERGPMFWLVPICIVVLAAALIGVVVVNKDGSSDSAASEASDGSADSSGTSGSGDGTGQTSESGQTSDEPDFSFLERHDAEDSRAVGDDDAPVTLIMYSDYQCPYCATWNDETLPELMDFVDDGELRLEMRDLAVFGEASGTAARAAFAAGEQDAYLEFHNALFDDGKHRSESTLSQDALITLAEDLGLDGQQFNQDMNAVTAHEDLEANSAEARSIGVTSTPAFIIGGTPILGAQPTKEFVDAVDSALAEADDTGSADSAVRDDGHGQP